MKRLCFGTYASVLRLCIPKKKTRLITPQKKFIGILLMSINSYYDITGDDYVTSRLINCENSLAADVTEKAQAADVKALAEYFKNKVLPLLDPNKTKLAVLTIRDIIASDSKIDEDTVIDLFSGMTKGSLRTQSEFVLENFMAGVFLYTARAVDNTAGKAYVKAINDDYLTGFEVDKDKIKLVDYISEEPRLLQSLALRECAAASALEKSVEKRSPNFSTYLKNAKDKYLTIKTLLYNDQPKPFYDFYVCNDIERYIPVNGSSGSLYELSIIKNVTIESLFEYSRFVILSGTGGLGKSMMMRHLLLNSLYNYKATLTIPVFIPLKDFDETAPSMFEYAFSKITSLCGEIAKDQFEDVLKKGKALLLFDGLDEIGSANAKRFERQLEVFTDKYPENCFVISSRPYQSFISYSRFTVLELKPFSKHQALKLIDNLEFRPDEPAIKEKFRTELESNLYNTHSTFTENPLLLTIMLLTFEQYAEVPSKMHVFYREAFAALAVKHDANKGAYKRPLKTGLTADKFADYFAELCSRSYFDEKFELTKEEFVRYYSVLKEREKVNDRTTTASDFLYDLCSNMCLMYFESGKYHFAHRSFQEYFCALYFSKQKDKHLKSIGDFFENRKNRVHCDKTFDMLYDMIPDKIEEYIFLPLLTEIYERCDSEEGFWTFLEIVYPIISYENGQRYDFVFNGTNSYLLKFIEGLNGITLVDCSDFPHYDSLLRDEYVYVTNEDGSQKLIPANEVDTLYDLLYGMPDIVGSLYEFEVKAVRKNPMEYKELLACLEDDEFDLKKEYVKLREYLKKLQAKQRPTGDSLFDLF